MKTLLPILFAFLSFLSCEAQVSSNKAFILGTNSSLRLNETNFFAVNSNLLNASVVAGGGFTGNPSQFSSAGGMSNIISGVALTNVSAQGISNSGYAVVAGYQTNSNTFRIYQGNFGDMMDWYGTGGAAAYMDHLANFTTLGNVAAAAFRDNQGFSTDGLGDVLAKLGTLSSNLFVEQTNFVNYEIITNTLTGTNFIGTDGNFLTLTGNFDGNQDNMLWSNAVYGQGAWMDGSGNFILSSGTSQQAATVFNNPFAADLPGFASLPNYLGPSVAYYQVKEGQFLIYTQGDGLSGSMEGMDIQPGSFFQADNADRLVATANSNNMDLRLQGDGTLSSGGLWKLSTNISGQTSFAMNMYCSRVLCNPASVSCTITAPSSDNVGYVIPTASVPFRNWGAQNATISSGYGLGPVWMTLEYEVENLGSNTANTLTVSLPNKATNWGGSSIVIPNQMGLRMHYGGTNNANAGYISAELYALSLSPTYNGQNITNVMASGVSNQFIGPGYSITNWEGTNHYSYWATNTLLANTESNWVVFTNYTGVYPYNYDLTVYTYATPITNQYLGGWFQNSWNLPITNTSSGCSWEDYTQILPEYQVRGCGNEYMYYSPANSPGFGVFFVHQNTTNTVRVIAHVTVTTP